MAKYYVVIEREVAVVVDADSKEQAEEVAMHKNFEGEEELLLNKVVAVTEEENIVTVHTKELQEILGCKQFNVNETFKYMEEE